MDTTQVPLGTPGETVSAFCDPDEIYAYALATNDDNPRYVDGSAVPPIYAVVPVFRAFMEMSALPPAALEGIRGGVHGEHDLYIHSPIVPGSHLHTQAQRWCVTTSKPGMTVTVRLTSTDDDGGLVLEQYWSSLLLGEVTGGDQGPALADHSFPDQSRDRLVGTVVVPTTRDQTFRYAGASGDRSIIHVSDESATAMGFPRKFNQGLCTLGVSSRGLIQLAAEGDPRRVRRVAVRFSAPTFPGDDIEVSVYQAGAAGDGRQAYAFEASSAGRNVLRHGRIEVDPA
jgi:acyl dehydratase